MQISKRAKCFCGVIFFALFFSASGLAENFVVSDIRVEGLKRIHLDTVLNYLPIKKGETFTSSKSSETLRVLYKTGFFNNVSFSRQGDVLVVTVKERLVIGYFNISGNKKITSKQLTDVLKKSGLAEGMPFDDAVLSGFKQGLLNQYHVLGYYNASIDAKVSEVGSNRVSVKIKITEGKFSKVKEIKISGNDAFSTKQLLKNFSMETSGLLTIVSGSDQYSKEKLDADLENLRSFYLDRGYLHFRVVSKQASMTDDNKSVFINIEISEGPVYRISGWKVEGILKDHDDKIEELINLNKGDVFSRKDILNTNNKIGILLSDYGYAMPNVEIEPEVDEATKQVFVVFKVSHGNRFYVRRINFSGNTKTKEEVLRREMRQHEGELFSFSKVRESERRLNNLGYLKDVGFKMEPVPKSKDEVDVNYSVTEAPSTGANLQLGYSDTDHLIFGASINEQNFLGTGKGVGLQFNHSVYTTTYSLRYFNPYFTEDNISLNLQVYNQQTKPGAIHLSSYTTDSYGGSAMYGIPLSDYSRLNLGYGFEYMHITLNDSSSDEMQSFVKRYGNVFNTINLMGGWSYSKLDRAIFPRDGFAQSLDFDVGVPAGLKGNLEYYRADYHTVFYKPFTKFFIIKLNGMLGYGNGYGSMHEMPFFKNYYCGGIGSVRGYEGSSLGPLDSNGDPIGGNVKAEGSLGLIFPNPFGEKVRTSAFVDVGNVFKNKLEFGDLRSSTGVQAEWLTPLGIAFTFSLAKPLNAKDGDRKDSFQMNIGASI